MILKIRLNVFDTFTEARRWRQHPVRMSRAGLGVGGAFECFYFFTYFKAFWTHSFYFFLVGKNQFYWQKNLSLSKAWKSMYTLPALCTALMYLCWLFSNCCDALWHVLTYYSLWQLLKTCDDLWQLMTTFPKVSQLVTTWTT